MKMCALLTILLISANTLLPLTNGQNVQIMYYNSTYSHSNVNLQNNFGNENGGSGGMGSNDAGGGSSSQHDESLSLLQDLKKVEISPFSPYFGVELVPYVRSASFPIGDYTKDDIRGMLRVILTKCHSVLTMEMGFPDQGYTDGPWDITTPSEIATVAAQLNSENETRIITISQGAGVLSKDGFQPDIEAAFNSAQHSNSIFPRTVWGITLIPNYYDSSTEGNVKIATSGQRVKLELEKHTTRAHGMNLRLGVFVDKCEDIMGGSLKELLMELAEASDYIVCCVYPSQPVADPQDYFNVVVNQYEMIRTSFHRYSPSVEVILQTGWATDGKSRNNPGYMNSGKKSKQFWDMMGKWAEDTRVRVFMHEAFDIPKRSGNSKWGYWRMSEDAGDYFVEKATGQTFIT